MKWAQKLVWLLFGVLLVAVSICRSYFFVVDSGDYIYCRGGFSSYGGQAAQVWTATDQRSGETHQILFTGSDRLVYHGTEYTYDVNFSLESSEISVSSPSSDFFFNSVHSGGTWMAGGNFDRDGVDLAGLFSNAVLIHTGLYFVRPSLFWGLLASLVAFLIGMRFARHPKNWIMSRRYFWHPEVEPNPMEVDGVRSVGFVLMGISALLFLIAWHLPL